MDEVELVARAIRASDVEDRFTFLLPDERKQIIETSWDVSVDAARAAIAAMPGWRPIETAPKVGAIMVSCLKGSGERFIQCVTPLPDGRWAISVADGVLQYFDADRPTHWMPLPAPPKETPE